MRYRGNKRVQIRGGICAESIPVSFFKWQVKVFIVFGTKLQKKPVFIRFTDIKALYALTYLAYVSFT